MEGPKNPNRWGFRKLLWSAPSPVRADRRAQEPQGRSCAGASQQTAPPRDDGPFAPTSDLSLGNLLVFARDRPRLSVTAAA